MRFIVFITLLSFCTSFCFAVSDAGLKEKVSKSRWLTMEDSRIIVNPTGISHTGELTPHFTDGSFGSLTFHGGYFCGDYPQRVPNILSWKPVDKSIKSNSKLGADFMDVTNLNWSDYDVKSARKGTNLEVILDSPVNPYGCVESEFFEIDMNKTPVLYLNLDGEELAGWGIKMGLQGGTDEAIVTWSAEKGQFAFDLRNYVKWTGKNNVYVRVFAAGKNGDTILVKRVAFGGLDPKVTGFEYVEETWQPSQINQIAKSDTRNINVNLTTFFADKDTVSRRMLITKADGNDLMSLGLWSKGEVKYLDKEKVLILRHPDYAIVTAFSGNPEFNAYAYMDDYVNGITSNDKIEFWTLRYESPKKGSVINTSSVFVPGGNVTDSIINKAKNGVIDSSIKTALKIRIADWDSKLSKIPEPENFKLTKLPYAGTSEKSLKDMYYKAWVFMISNILEPTPETGFNYYQFPTGKSSLWSEGHASARPSAQWDSFIAMQFMGYVNPDKSWNALKGMMSLADENGVIDGEGLPPRHCQTAWILYNLTDNKNELIELYPAMKRYLEWRIRDPRWIYKNSTDERWKDAECYVHSLIEMNFMVKICKEIGNINEAIYWEKKIKPLYDEYVNYFWEERGGDPYIYYVTGENQRYTSDSWSLLGLGLVKDNVIEEPEKSSLINMYNKLLDLNRPFLIQKFTKHATRNYLERGLLWNNMYDDAQIIAESTIRDITRAGGFSEEYNNHDASAEPKLGGVIPSIFGAANTIDFALCLNNLWVSEGMPTIINLRNGGVKNLNIRGKILNISVKNGNVEISGTATDILKLPNNFKAVGKKFTGKISGFDKLELELK